MKTTPFLLAVLATAATADEGGFKVVVNSRCALATISREDLSRLFLKKTANWVCGDWVQAVDQADDSEVRARFTSDVHRKSLKAVKAYWRQQIFSGQDVPPPEKSTDEEVVEFVRGHTSGIGYVSKDALTRGVRVLEVRP
jgi:ABC-type phosphate transport system substrate-binding protein